MARPCTVCTHSERLAIDQALLAGELSNRRIASQYDVTERAIRNHKAEHLAERMAEVAERNAEADVRTAIDVRAQLKAINDETLGILKNARRMGSDLLALQAIDRIHKQIELQAKLIDLINDGTTVNVILSPQWTQFRTTVLNVLQEHPDARKTLAEALRAMEGAEPHDRVA